MTTINNVIQSTSKHISEEELNKYQGEAISAEKEINDKVNKAINSATASRRWFWELLQNAIDTVDDSKKVKVNLEIYETEKGVFLTFRHFGGTFREARQKYRFDDFKNLINPTSGKSVEDTSTIGKFGTGFLSTHILSLKIDVKGVFENSSNERYEVSTCLDRNDFLLKSDEARGKRIESIIHSLVNYEESKKERPSVDESSPVASFTYYLNENKFNNKETVEEIIKDGLGEIEHSLPFVMTFTSKIEEVVIHDKRKGEIITYKEDDNSDRITDLDGLNVKSIVIEKNNNPLKKIGVTYLSNDDCSIAWKIEGDISDRNFSNCREDYQKELNHEMCSLFSTFPLIGSQDFKFPLILHSAKFDPNTERDGINLLENDEENKRIIESAAKLYKKYLEKAEKQFNNLYHICDIEKEIKNDHNWIDAKWFNKYQDDLKKTILQQKLIDTSSLSRSRKSIVDEDLVPQLYFPDIKIRSGISDEKNNALRSEIYNFAKRLYPGLIPTEDVLEPWKNILWDDKEKIVLIDERALIDKIAESNKLESFAEYFNGEDMNGNISHELAKDWLIKFYDFLIKGLNNRELLDYSGKVPKQGIVLSRNNKFKLFSELKNDIGFKEEIINKQLLNLYKVFFPNNCDYREKLLLNDLSNLVHIKEEKINEESIADEIKKEANELIKKHDDFLKDSKPGDLEKRKDIEEKLSALQVWIAGYNSERNYFDNYIKRKILQAIIDEKKSNSLTELLELDRNETKSLEAQAQIMKDPDLDEKLKEGEKALKAIADNDKDFENRKAKGKFFENYLKELLDGKFGKGNVHNVDGTQDFIIFDKFYVELKTTQGGREVKVSPEQADEAKQRDKDYYLAVFCYSDVYKDVSIEVFENNLMFTNTFGELVTPLVNSVKELEKGGIGINIVYPDFYHSFEGMKPYRYVVNKKLWGKLKFNDFVNEIRSKQETSIQSN